MTQFGKYIIPYIEYHIAYAAGALLAFLSFEVAIYVQGVLLFGTMIGSLVAARMVQRRSTKP